MSRNNNHVPAYEICKVAEIAGLHLNDEASDYLTRIDLVDGRIFYARADQMPQQQKGVQ